MPAPGFPDWLGPGAIVTEQPDSGAVIHPGVRYIVLGIELQLPRFEGGVVSCCSVSLAPLNDPSTSPAMGPVEGQGLLTVLLGAFLELYQWVGEYLTPEGAVIGVGTTLPVTMRARAIRAGELVTVEGSVDHNGVYEMIGPTVTGQIILQPRPTTREEATETLFRAAYGILDDPPYWPDEILDTESAEPETDRPHVRDGQIWLLPEPNRGRWRVTVNSEMHLPVELRHTVDGAVMRCHAAWLVDHGVRQEPLDPRQSQPGQITYGQVWEFVDTPARLGRRIPAGRYRVMEVDAGANRVRLHAENGNGNGKRLYLEPSTILARGTFCGDGLPRRTAFERILEDETE